MLSLTKLRPKGRHYYRRELGGPAIDSAGPGYWLEAPEMQGRWMGRGAEALGLSGRVVEEAGFERLFGSGADPTTGRPLGRGWDPNSERAVAGYALTFSPPKSVSVLWACGGEDVAGEVTAAHDAAAAVGLAHLEDHAGFTRRGRGGVLQVDTEGYVAAAFTHRTSRAADPQLHTHVLVSNKARATDDGKWLSVDGTEIYRSQKAAGMIYKAALRAELTRRVGVSWSLVDHNGIAEIEGVPVGLAEAWSKRRAEVRLMAAGLVAEKEAALGRSLNAAERAEAHQIAAYRTRAPKVCGDEPTETLRDRWRAEAISWGYDPATWLGRVLGRAPLGLYRDVEASALDPLDVVEILDERYATWGRAEAVEVISTLVPETTGSAASTLEAVEAAADALLADSEVLRLSAPLPAEAPASLRRADGMAAVEHHGAARFTTRATLRQEAAVLEAAAAGINARAAVVPDALVAATLAGAGLGEDQSRAVEHLLGGGERIACLVGPAGAGKSRSLAAARAGWEAAGHTVVGLAPSAMAAAVLAGEAGIASDTLAKFLHTARQGPSALTARSVVVVDEASMARTADLAALVGHVQRAGAKLVLVGDDHQLGAVGAGGLFATLVADHGAAELSTVRRFGHAWERAASLRLRAGDTAILAAYHRHGRITGGDRQDMLDAAFAAWSAARAEGRSVVVMAGDNDTVDALALRARAARAAAGEVSAHARPAGRQVVGFGDDVISLRNDRRLVSDSGEWVRNGARWRVEAIDADGAATLSSLDGHGCVRVPGTYVSEHLALAYATTIHKAQGLTVDYGVVVVEASMAAESLYVGMTRGRLANRAMVVCEGPDTDHERAWSLAPAEVLGRVMGRPGAEASAHQVLRAELARFDDAGLFRDLIEEHRLHVDANAGPDRSREIETLTRRVGVATAQACDDALEVARTAQLRRLAWLEAHPAEVAWGQGLRERLGLLAQREHAGDAVLRPDAPGRRGLKRGTGMAADGLARTRAPAGRQQTQVEELRRRRRARALENDRRRRGLRRDGPGLSL